LEVGLGAAPFAFKGAVFFLLRFGSALSAGLGLCCHSEPAVGRRPVAKPGGEAPRREGVAAGFLERRAKNPSSFVLAQNMHKSE
jgi:hypothetical protein